MKIALWAAATSGDVARVQELPSQGVDAEAQNWEEYEFGQTALHYAATNGHVDVVEALLAHRVNVHVVDS
ncbi:hypothetical protein Poli38472_014688 [Pythium oligandrum]|uniref:Ankyrin repeat protein n=1 Tax=Pythium oligandrum TaxID=41045 RepID=A0A8K1CKE2_PYTOL|nr:hypothetical protein Poli38472_014688 [Pythium oligandrum]|eukprot:TMW63983.1 hypothetical protein Poli38472_014688 [Pythium oligandrum]